MTTIQAERSIGGVSAPSRPAGTSGTGRLPSLTGLRFIAALMVFAFHGSLLFVFRDPSVQGRYMTDAATAGFVGVSFFFVLSGFVLTWSARPGGGAAAFWRRRFVRIVPNHVVTFAAALVLLAWAGQASGVPQALTNLVLLQSWVPDIAYVGSGNDVSWSLSVEVLFYLSFPLLFALVRRIRPSRLWYWAGGTAAAVVLLPLAAQALLPDTPHFIWGPASFTQIWSVYEFPVSRSLEFVLGMLLARIVLTGRWVRVGVLPAAVLAVGAYIGSLHAPFLFRFAAVTVIPLGILIAAVASADVAGRRTVLSTRPMVWLGEISFAFYMVHKLVLQFGHLAFGRIPNGMGGVSGPAWSTPGGAAFLAGCFLVSLLLAWGLSVGVERPLVRRWSSRRTQREELHA
jgi:peptidoglycan/LPS O-acetylase OafA/YrhL